MVAKKKNDSTETNETNSNEFPGLPAETREALKRKGYVPLSGSSKVGKWSVGQIVEGKFCGLKKAKFGFLFSVENPNGEMETWPATKSLEPSLLPIALGTEIYVECVGTKPSDYNNEMWLFELFAKPSHARNE